MNFNDENGIYSMSKTIIAQVVDKTDELLKTTIVEYAQKKSKELGKEIEVLFLDKDVVDEIIRLGIEAYEKSKWR